MENLSFPGFSVKTTEYREKFDAWSEFCYTTIRGFIQSYIQDPIKYNSLSFLSTPMVDRMLIDAQLVPTSKVHGCGKLNRSTPPTMHTTDIGQILKFLFLLLLLLLLLWVFLALLLPFILLLYASGCQASAASCTNHSLMMDVLAAGCIVCVP